MAVRALFFDATGGDRTYNAADFEPILAAIVAQGVVPGIGTDMAITENSPTAMNVLVGIGKAFINGKLLENTTVATLTISAANATNPRIDRIVARVNYTSRIGEIVVKAGTPAASPVPPSLQRDSSIYEVSLAQVRVNASATSINNANITDERSDGTVAGYATIQTRVDHTKSINTTSGDPHTQYLNNARHDLTARHGSSVVDHGSIGGLGDDDHTQYYNAARLTASVLNALGIDHGSLAGLSDDDHSQYALGSLFRMIQPGYTGVTGAQVVQSGAATVGTGRRIRVAAYMRFFRTAGTVTALDFAVRVDGNIHQTQTVLVDSPTATGIYVEAIVDGLSAGSHVFSSIATVFGGATITIQSNATLAGLWVEDIGPAR